MDVTHFIMYFGLCVEAEVPLTASGQLHLDGGRWLGFFKCYLSSPSSSSIFLQLLCGTALLLIQGVSNPSFIAFVFHLIMQVHGFDLHSLHSDLATKPWPSDIGWSWVQLACWFHFGILETQLFLNGTVLVNLSYPILSSTSIWHDFQVCISIIIFFIFSRSS